MYTIRTTFEVSASHKLALSYASPCARLHGHNWRITVTCRSATLNADGMVTDFASIKNLIKSTIDHRALNDVLPFNPTAENIARWIVDNTPNAIRAEVQESEGNVAIYETEEV